MNELASSDLLLIPSPVLVVGIRRVVLLEDGKGPREIRRADASGMIAGGMIPIICHQPSVARRLGSGPFKARDVLELFAFVFPAQTCLPTINGIADALGLARPENLEASARLLVEAASRLIDGMRDMDERDKRAAAPIVSPMARGGWGWASAVRGALDMDDDISGGNLDIWRRLPEWSEYAPEPPPGNIVIDPAEARAPCRAGRR